uniref:Uncharacterized protein n=1 Tax=Chenopodium quinoa TaxID=63459 RepID=A0A803MV97_CHEQI
MDFVEFQESDVMFSDYSSDQSMECNNENEENVEWTCKHNNIQSNGSSKMVLKRRKSLKKKTQKVSSSLPIHIPGSGNQQYTFRYESDEASSDFDDEDQMMRLPPHLIVERRRANKDIARSFPLKERNLYYVRNCIIMKNDELS